MRGGGWRSSQSSTKRPDLPRPVIRARRPYDTRGPCARVSNRLTLIATLTRGAVGAVWLSAAPATKRPSAAPANPTAAKKPKPVVDATARTASVTATPARSGQGGAAGFSAPPQDDGVVKVPPSAPPFLRRTRCALRLFTSAATTLLPSVRSVSRPHRPLPARNPGGTPTAAC